VKTLLFCHAPQDELVVALILYCVVQSVGAVVALTVILFTVAPVIVRVAGATVVCWVGPQPLDSTVNDLELPPCGPTNPVNVVPVVPPFMVYVKPNELKF
jgi:hypothetical protein